MLTMRPRARLEHGAGDGLDGVEGARQVGGDDVRPVLGLHAHDEVVAGDARVVDEDVDPPEGPQGGLDERHRPKPGRRRRPARPGPRGPSASISASGPVGGVRVAPVADADVGALAWRGAGRWRARCRASHPSRRRSCPRGRSCAAPPCACRLRARPGTTSSSGTGGPPGSASTAAQPRRDGVHGVPSRAGHARWPRASTSALRAESRRVRRPRDGHRAAREAGPEGDEHEPCRRAGRARRGRPRRARWPTDAADVLP